MATTIQNSTPPTFTGEFRHALDNKNRLTIPAKWRFAEEVELFLIPKALKKCVSVMTRAEMARVMGLADELEPADRANFLDTFGRMVRQTTLDKAGRITLPDDLCKRLNFSGEVMLSGSVATFNIWSLADFATETATAEAAANTQLRRLGI